MVSTPVDVVERRAPVERALARVPPRRAGGDPAHRPRHPAGPQRATRTAAIPIEMSQRFLRWWQTRCYPNAATPNGGPTDQRDAPVPAPAGLESCGANNGSSIGTPERARATRTGTIVIYGDRAVPDPYDGAIDRHRPLAAAAVLQRRPRDAVPDSRPPGRGAHRCHRHRRHRDRRARAGHHVEGRPRLRERHRPRLDTRPGGRARGNRGTGHRGSPAATSSTTRHATGSTSLYRGPVGEIYVQYRRRRPRRRRSRSRTRVSPDAGRPALRQRPRAPAASTATRFFAPVCGPPMVGGRDRARGRAPGHEHRRRDDGPRRGVDRRRRDADRAHFRSATAAVTGRPTRRVRRAPPTGSIGPSGSSCSTPGTPACCRARGESVDRERVGIVVGEQHRPARRRP